MSFAEKIILENNDIVMIYRCKKGGMDSFSYVLCNADGVKRMRHDYENSIAAQPYDYGKVLYSDLIKDPDEKAISFLNRWQQENC